MEETSLLPEGYNVLWDSQSANASESMPLGGGDVGLNVWVEGDELLMYLSQSGTFDENNQMLKHGRVRVRLEPNPFEGAEQFSQELRLEEGCISISASNEKLRAELLLWVDVERPVVHVECQSSIPVEVHAQYESWRTEDQELPIGTRHACFSFTSYPGKVVKYKDEIQAMENSVQWMHRNREDKLLIDFCIEQQGLEEVRDRIHDTQRGRTFGGMLFGAGMIADGTEEGIHVSTPYTAWKLRSKKASKKNDLLIALETGQYPSEGGWNNALNVTMKEGMEDHSARDKTLAWWKQFWERSWIHINTGQTDPSDPAWQVGRNYQLFRYMLGCNAYGTYPSKFNGSLFTVDPVFVEEKGFDLDPDFRQWGGGSFTAQNQRLVYWPLLKTGDFDMMPSQFNYYRDALSSAEARTEVYWGHEGACFTEQLENFGLPFAGGWGFDSGARKRLPETEYGVQTNRYVNHHYVNQLEFSLMILDYHRFSGEDISSYLPFIKSSLRFFDEHYQYRQKKRSGQPLDKNGKLVFYPSTAAEMYKIARNPTDVIAALQTILPRMLELPSTYVSAEEKEYFASYLERVPDIPFDEKEGHRVIKPAESWEYAANQEIPEMYPVFPYGIYGLFKPDLETAVNTWHYGESNEKRKFIDCWSQVGIFAARLGLMEEAKHLVMEKLKDSGRRFPAFWGPGPDWVPDVDHGGAGMINLQEMLMQTDGKAIYLFPTWPRDWDVKFKLHAPFQTTVEGELRDGELMDLKVLPAERSKDVQMYFQEDGDIFTYHNDIPGEAFSQSWGADVQGDCPIEASGDFVQLKTTGRFANYTKADTWYPSWAADGNLYSGWTDGTIGDMPFVWSALWDKAITGQARIEGDDPLKLKVVNLGTHVSSALPYQGRYPCGSLVHNGIWYYGTYALHQPNRDIGKDFGWYILGPFIGFRWSDDYGQTWHETSHVGDNPLFDDPPFDNYDMEDGSSGAFVKMGAPHFVDFGQNMEHSLDGKAYLVGHGSSEPDLHPRVANNSWNSGDEIYLARVSPSIENMNNADSYEFFAGKDEKGEDVWTREYQESKPIFQWNNRCGIVTMTYNNPLDKYLMCITHANKDTTSRGYYDTYILESDQISGPWQMISYMEDFGKQAYFVNIPSKFISEDGHRMWLCYSANYMFDKDRSNPEFLESQEPRGSAYALSLHEIELIRKED